MPKIADFVVRRVKRGGQAHCDSFFFLVVREFELFLVSDTSPINTDSCVDFFSSLKKDAFILLVDLVDFVCHRSVPYCTVGPRSTCGRFLLPFLLF